MALTPTDTLQYEVRHRKAYITLNRPEAMNAQNAEMGNALGEAIYEFRHDDEQLVAIITGAGGRAFSAGADLKEMSARDHGAQVVERRMNGHEQARLCEKSIIAAIDGYAVGAGLELAVKCDIRIATEQSRLGLPEPRRSLLAGPGLHNLSRLIPLGEALLIQLTGSHMPAARAYEVGLIQRLLPDREALMAEADAIADEILLCAPLAVQAIKRIVTIGREVPVEYSEHLAKPIQDAINVTEDRLEGPKAFAEKRPPVWKMR